MSDPVFLAAWAAGLGAGLVLVAGLGLMVTGRGLAARRRRLSRAMATTGRTDPAAPRLAKAQRPAQKLLAGLSGWLERFNVISGGEAQRSADLLAAAGFAGRDALVIYVFVKTIAPLAVALAGVVWVFALAGAGGNRSLQLGVVAGLALLTSRATDAVINHYRNRRMAAARRGFPDMLELFVIASEAGLGLQPALDRVAREMRGLYPELAEELARMTSEMRLTNDRKRVLDGLALRLPLPEIGHFTQTLLQAERHGTPFSAAMRILMRDQRADRIFRVEEKAARLPVLMTLPLIFLIMPSVFVVLIGPAALSVLDNIVRGM